MNKSLYIVIVGILIVAGFIGYTLFGKQEAVHTEGDGHTDHSQETTSSAPHDDTGLEPHTD